jgi:alpha-L-fucosidase
VTVALGGVGTRAIDNFHAKVKSAVWMDNGESICFTQNAERGILAVDCTGFPYGSNTVVRVMKIETV